MYTGKGQLKLTIMDLAAVLTQSLLVAGVSDAELVVQIILSNGVDINTLLEEIILSDEGLQKLGIDPATETSTIFRDYLLQSLAELHQNNQNHTQTDGPIVGAAPLPLPPPIQNNDHGSGAEDEEASTVGEETSSTTSTSNNIQYNDHDNNDEKAPSTTSASNIGWTVVTHKSKHKSDQYHGGTVVLPQAIFSTGSVSWDILPHSSPTTIPTPTPNDTALAPTSTTNHIPHLEFLASMFDFSLEVVTDVYFQSNRNIEQSMQRFFEMLSQNEPSPPPLQSPSQQQQPVKEYYNHSHWQDEMQINPNAVLTPTIQLCNLFPDASTAEIKVALARFSNDLELAAAHLIKTDDMRKEEKIKRNNRKMRRNGKHHQQRHHQQQQRWQQQQQQQPVSNIKVVMSMKKENVISAVDAANGKGTRTGISQGYSDEELEAASHETESVEYLHRQMENCFRRAANLWSKGQTAHAAICSDEGRTFRKRRKLARLRDSQFIFNQNNNKNAQNSSVHHSFQEHKTSCKVDLHGLHQSEAIKRVQMAIASFQQSEKSSNGTPKKSNKIGYIDFVTGRGIHSLKQKSRLMPAVQKWLKQKHVPHQVYKSKGYVRVTVKM